MFRIGKCDLSQREESANGSRQIPHQTIASDQFERLDGRHADLRLDVDRTVLRWPY